MKFDSEMRIKIDKILEQDGLLEEVRSFAQDYREYLYERKQLIMEINVRPFSSHVK